MSAADPFSTHAPAATNPADDAFPITPSDTTDLSVMVRALRIASTGTGGIVRVTTRSGTVRDLPIAAGEQWEVRVSRVWTTGTTATGIWGFV